jgi:hypothetical protein
MAKFVDASGVEWVVVIPFSLVRRKRAEGIDLLNPEVMGRLLDDAVSASDLLFWICEIQAKERGLSADEFGDLAFEVREQAWESLVDAVRDFFLKSGNEAAAAMIVRAQLAAKRISDHAMSKVEGGAFEALIAKGLVEADARMEALLKQGLGS